MVSRHIINLAPKSSKGSVSLKLRDIVRKKKWFIPACYEHLSVAEVPMTPLSWSVWVKYDPHRSKDTACCLLYPGDGVPNEVIAAAATVVSKHNTWFVDQCPASFKAGLNHQLPTVEPGRDQARFSSLCVCCTTPQPFLKAGLAWTTSWLNVFFTGIWLREWKRERNTNYPFLSVLR